jgi:hypothetical protein
MAQRKNKKRIDPRYFLNETVDRGEEQQLDEIWPFGGGSKKEKNQKFWDKEGYELAKARLEKLGAERGLHREVEKEFVANSRLPDQMGVNAAVRDVLKGVKAGKDAPSRLDRARAGADRDRDAISRRSKAATRKAKEDRWAKERRPDPGPDRFRLQGQGDGSDPYVRSARSSQLESLTRDHLKQIVREEIKRILKE